MVSNRRTTQDHMRKLGPVVPKSSILRSHDTRIIGGRREARARAGGEGGCAARARAEWLQASLSIARGRSPADTDATAVVLHNYLHNLEVWGR